MDMLESYYEYNTPCTCSQETNIQNRIHRNVGTTKSAVTKKGPEVVNKTVTENGKYTILPSRNADSISAVYLDVNTNPPIWDVDGMKYQGSEITKFPDNWRFAPRTENGCSYMFSSCSSLTSLDLSNFDTSKVTNMSDMFWACSSLTSLELSSFDTSKVTNMSSMFHNCDLLKSLNLSSFDTSKVTNMYNMLYNCKSLTSLDLSNFDTSEMTSMGYMFGGCSSLTSLDLSSFDTSKVYDIGGMFYNCSLLTSLDLSSFDMSKVTNAFNMFIKCSSLQTITKGSFKNLKVSLDLSNCVVLSKQSVVDLFDSIGTANSGAKITLASAVYSQLSEDEIKVATNKGWTVASK